MNSTPTSITSGGNIGNYALAGSLILHAGFIGLFSVWQWDLRAPEKTKPKTIHVKFIAAPPTPKTAPKQALSKPVSSSPAQPMAVRSAAITPLKPRTPNPVFRPGSPVKAARRINLTSKSNHRTPLVQEASFSIKAAKQMRAHYYQSTQPNRKFSKRMEVRSSPVLSAHPTRSIPGTAAAPHLKSNRQSTIRRRPPVSGIRLFQVKGTANPTALLTEPMRSRIHINNHLPRSVKDQTTPTFTAGVAPRSIVESHGSKNITEIKLSALPGNFSHDIPAADNATREDLGLLRGTFTGKVRQRIAEAKYYPRVARRRGMEGQPVIAFTLDKQGRLQKVDLARTSGYTLLDQAALEAVQNGAPYPEIPAPLKMDSIQLKLPISFILK